MAFSKSFIARLCLFSLSCSTAFAAPVAESNKEIDARFTEAELVKRVPGDSASDPIQAHFDITNWQSIAEEDCYDMLCVRGGQRIYQRMDTESAANRQYIASGAKLGEFRPDQLDTRHTAQINSGTISAEEFPWKSTQQGGENANVYPASMAEQRSQGGTITAGYRGAYGGNNVPRGKWFEITFVGGPLGKFCAALFSNPQDFSVCTKKTKETLFDTKGVDISDFSYHVNRNTRPITFDHVGTKYSKVKKRSDDFEELATQANDEPFHI